MILAEKIAMLRKQNGWSQEELAMKLNISRQSVSKWESTASIPDLDKIIKLSEIFGVSTDYLLKDEIEDEIISVGDDGTAESVRSVSLEEANAFMELTAYTAKRIALGVMLCILSPITMILLGGMAEYGFVAMSEDEAGSIGAIILLLMVGVAVAIFILKGMKLDKYSYLETEKFSLEYGTYGIVEKKKQDFEPVFRICITVGVLLCIFGVIPLFLAVFFQEVELLAVYSVGILLFMVSIGVYLFVWSGMIYGSYQKLLQEADYTVENKKIRKKTDRMAGIYWCIVTAIYLGISFYTMRCDRTWIVWPCAGVFFAALCGIVNVTHKEN